MCGGCGVVGRGVLQNVKKTLFRGCCERDVLRKLSFRLRGMLAWHCGVGVGLKVSGEYFECLLVG